MHNAGGGLRYISRTKRGCPLAWRDLPPKEEAGTDKKISRALISVTDKTGVVEFAQSLVSDYGVEIISTGGTARVLEEAGVPVIPICRLPGDDG